MKRGRRCLAEWQVPRLDVFPLSMARRGLALLVFEDDRGFCRIHIEMVRR